MTYPEGTEGDAWDSDIDSVSSSDTPDYKRGKHDIVSLDQVKRELIQDYRQARQACCHISPTVEILADSRLSRWSKVDRLCKIEYKQVELKRWIADLWAEVVRIQCNTVVLYLEQTTRYKDVPPLNKLLALCKVIRQHNSSARIFVSNLLPQPATSPLTRAHMEADFMLVQAIRGVNRLLKKVHYLSLFEHFVSRKKGKIIHPTFKYFQEDGNLTTLGCLVFCECVFRECGLKKYWFV